MKIVAVQGNFCTENAISLTCLSLLDTLTQHEIIEYWGYGFSAGAQRPYTRAALPPFALKLAYSFGLGDGALYPVLGLNVEKTCKTGDAAWIWPPTTPSLANRLRRRGVFVVNERVNTCIRMFRRSVDAAYRDLGWPNPAKWAEDDDTVEAETRVVMASDAAFAPNQFVRESLLEIGFPEERIIDSSYGWSPSRLADTGKRTIGERGRMRFLFVGTGSVRKGLPVLLRAWRDASVDADLVIAGKIEQEVEDGCASLLALPNVQRIGHVRAIADVYRSCDVFVFPTHEEGGPQVTFEAAGCGLALLVSPMGTGGAFRPGLDATVADPLMHDEWVHQLRRHAGNPDLVDDMRKRAETRSLEFTWERVAARRLEGLRASMAAFGK